MNAEVKQEGDFLRLLINSNSKLQKILLREANDSQTKVIVEILLNTDSIDLLKNCGKFKPVKIFLKKKRFNIESAKKLFSKNSVVVVKAILSVLSDVSQGNLSVILACDDGEAV